MRIFSLARARAVVRRWQSILPILVAEFVVLIGFGALLPVLPLYITDQGVEPATLGVVLAAWPATRLLAEPVFGWFADRSARLPLMLAGLLAVGISAGLPLIFHGAIELVALRALGGLGAAMYDPAARGYLIDASPTDQRGEVFGYYTAAQMGGLVVGPAVGAFGVLMGGGLGFPFVFAAATCAVAALYLAGTLRGEALSPGEQLPPRAARAATIVPLSESSYAGYGIDSPAVTGRQTLELVRDGLDPNPREPLRRLLNRPFLAATVMNFGLYMAVGVYEVTWSLYLTRLGATVLWIGVTFMLFGAPVLVLAPIAGRLVDRLGGLRFAVGGSLVVAAAGVAYSLAWEPYLPGAVIVVEAVGNAFLGPALFTLVAQGTPRGLSSTAQGLFGGAGTLGLIISSAVAGVMFAANPRLPFLFFAVANVATASIGIVMTRGGRRSQRDPRRAWKTAP